ncbi:MAG: HEAT repeat domain-containing protein [Bacteroidales bacterium]|nr:HEAT repeat domain-containing protein [Bacteroidales bacterium]
MGRKHPIRRVAVVIGFYQNQSEGTVAAGRDGTEFSACRQGRGCYASIEPYWTGLFRFAHDEEASVRLAFIWASENVATNTPDPYKDYLPLFAELLHDPDDKVRMEAPEMFRVLGKRRLAFVAPYLELLRHIAETDSNRVVRIHCLGVVKAAGRNG